MKFGNWKLHKYLIAGALNTGLTYLLYLMLARLMPYIWAYSLTFVAGIVLGYFFNALWVFKSSLQWKSLVSYPLAYLINYALGVLLLWLLVEKFRLPKEIAPLLVVIFSVPIMYAITKAIFRGGKKSEEKTEHQ